MAEDNSRAPDQHDPVRVLLIEDMDLEAELTIRHLHKQGIAHVVQDELSFGSGG